MGVIIVIAYLLGSALSDELKNTYKINCTCEPESEEICSSDLITYKGECEMKCSNAEATVLYRMACDASDLYDQTNLTSTQPDLTSTQSNLTSTESNLTTTQTNLTFSQPNLTSTSDIDQPSISTNLTSLLLHELLMPGPAILNNTEERNEYPAFVSEPNLISSTGLPELQTLPMSNPDVTSPPLSTLRSSEPDLKIPGLSEQYSSLSKSEEESENSPSELSELTTMHSTFTNVTSRSASNGVVEPTANPNIKLQLNVVPTKLPPTNLLPRNQFYNTVQHNLALKTTARPYSQPMPNYYGSFYPDQLPFLSTSPLLRYPSLQTQQVLPNQFYPGPLPPPSSPRSIRSYPPKTNNRYPSQHSPVSQQPSEVDPPPYYPDLLLDATPLPVSLQSLLSRNNPKPPSKPSPLYFYKPFPQAPFTFPGSMLQHPKFSFSPQLEGYRSAEGNAKEAEHLAAKAKQTRLLNEALKEIQHFYTKKNGTKQ